MGNHQSDKGDHAVFEHMDKEKPRLADPFGSCSAHIVLADFLDENCPVQPHIASEVHEHHQKHRQQQETRGPQA